MRGGKSRLSSVVRGASSLRRGCSSTMQRWSIASSGFSIRSRCGVHSTRAGGMSRVIKSLETNVTVTAACWQDKSQMSIRRYRDGLSPEQQRSVHQFGAEIATQITTLEIVVAKLFHWRIVKPRNFLLYISENDYPVIASVMF